MSNYLLVDGTGRVSTPDHASLDITGDIDLRVLCRPNTLDVSAAETFFSKGNTYRFELAATDALKTFWHNGSSLISQESTVDPDAIPLADGVDFWFRTTLDVDNGASGYDIKFWYSERTPVSWVQVGATVTGGTTTAIRAGTEALDVGQAFGGAGFNGRIYEAIVLNGIGGSEVAHFNADDFNVGDSDTDTAVDTTGRTWTINGANSEILSESNPNNAMLLGVG